VPYRVLIPLDGSPLAEHALVPAAELARRSGGTARLVRVHVPVVPITPFGDLAPPIYDPSWDADLRKLAEAYLMSTADSHRAAFGATPTTELREGPDVSHQIEEAAAEFGADIIAMTTHGHGGWAASWLGSIADGVIRTTHRLVLVIPERATDSSFDVKRIVVALDGSEAASAMVEPARAVAALFNAQITLVRVVAPPLVGEMLTALNSEGLDRFGVDSYAEHAKGRV
jgi:nucleotide-binding universal stress UspA family protein